MTSTIATQTPSASLREADREMFARFGIPPDLLDAAGVRRVTDREARDTLGVSHRGNLDGLLYPRRDPDSGQDRGYRLRRDHPEIETNGTPVDKYLSSVDRQNLFWPPDAASLLLDTTVTVVVVESEKATLAMVAAASKDDRPLLVIGLGGCWGFRGRIGKTVDATGARVDEKGVLPDFDRVAWTDRDVVILLDANVATNRSVQAARGTLARELRERQASVRLCTLPHEAGINGPDDFLAVHGHDALFALIDEAGGEPDAGRGGGTRESQATQLVKLARAAGVEWFHDDDQAYLHVRVDGHAETYLLRSKYGRAWLQHLFIDATDKCAGGQAIADALNALEAAALRGPAQAVHVRIAAVDAAIYIDLGDPMRRMVEITASGWRIVTDAPVRFRRPRAQLALPIPETGGNIRTLRPFLNLSDDDFILLVAVLLAYVRGRGPYPVLVVNGEQGSAKSTLAKVLKALIDPTGAPLRSEPRDPRDLMIAASNSHLLAFDNLSQVAPWLSDALCRLATGGGFATRTLYENREEETFEAVRPVVLNGIPELASRPDLISRAVVLSLPTIADDRRRPESQFWADLERARPRLLGALYEMVSIALQHEPGVSLATLPRMADFALWVTAAEPACPWEPGGFMRVYASNRRNAEESALDGDPVADLARVLADETWVGTAGEFLDRLNQATPESTQRRPSWFRQPRQVSDTLRRLAPALRQAGTDVTFPPRQGRRRLIAIGRPPEQGSADASCASPASPDAGSAGAVR